MPPPLRCPSLLSSISCTKQVCTAVQSRSFSSTLRNDQRVTRARRQLFQWLTGLGNVYYAPLPGSTNYMGAYDKFGELRRVVEARNDRKELQGRSDAEGREFGNGEKSTITTLPRESGRDMMPFPANQQFRSQAVLSEGLREEIWERVMRQGHSVRQVSAALSVEMSRVGAVVRLKEIEKEWQRIGKPLARPYARAVLGMLPETTFDPSGKSKFTAHESINDLPVHAWTRQQLFYPTSESRVFTRVDAAKAFNDNLLPADARIPHPEQIEQHKDTLAGLEKKEMFVKEKARRAAEVADRQRAIDHQARKEAAIKRVDKGRFEFRITDVNVDDAGKTGRGTKGVGWRYGHPNMDRKRGSVFIPTSVE